MAAEKAAEVRPNKTDVFVMAFGGKGFDGMLKERMRICDQLWEAGISTELLHKAKPKLQARKFISHRTQRKFPKADNAIAEFKAAETNKIPFAVILGQEELAAGQVK